MSIPTTGLSHDELHGEKLAVSPRRARFMLDCGNTRLYELLKNKELDSYLDGRSRKITVASIHHYVARKLAAAGAIRSAVVLCVAAACSIPTWAVLSTSGIKNLILPYEAINVVASPGRPTAWTTLPSSVVRGHRWGALSWTARQFE